MSQICELKTLSTDIQILGVKSGKAFQKQCLVKFPNGLDIEYHNTGSGIDSVYQLYYDVMLLCN